MATLALAYGTAIGILLTVGFDLFVGLFDRVAALGFGLRMVANPVTASGLGGALAGVVPGMVATTAFHDYRGPFMGAPLIASSLVGGSLLIAVRLTRRACRERRPHEPVDDRRIARAAVLAMLVAAAAWAVCSPLVIEYAYAQARGSVSADGVMAGALAGAVGGGALGLYVGLVLALGRGGIAARRAGDRGV